MNIIDEQRLLWYGFVFFFKQKTAYEVRISDWSSDVCSSDLEAEPAAAQTVFYDLPQMLVNLNTGGSKKNYLKIAISLELTSESDSVALENLLPRVVDNFQVYLRELRVEDLRGSAGVQRLREELLLRVKKAVDRKSTSLTCSHHGATLMPHSA